MNTSIGVARFHLANPVKYVAVPSGLLAFGFAMSAVAFGLIIPSSSGPAIVGGPTPGTDLERALLAPVFVFFFVLGVQSVSSGLPFGLTLGASRRSFFSGTALLGAGLAVAFGLLLAVLQVLESVTGGWGLAMHFFRVWYNPAGLWYATWLTSFVGLAALFVYGMWYGTVYRRWGAAGVVWFVAAQALVAFALYAGISVGYSWHAFKGYLATLTPLDLTGLFAALAVVVLVGGLATIRRVAV